VESENVMQIPSLEDIRISVVIPSMSPGQTFTCLSALTCMDWDPSRVEVIIALGKNPSMQRNRAVEVAKGDIVYFLDSDSRPRGDLFIRGAALLSEGDFSVVGGPSVTPATDTPFQRAVDSIFCSPFGGASVRARYTPVGITREATENDLILCNMAMLRQVFVENGGFFEELYPNEENEFLNRIATRGFKLAYCPESIVYRSQRSGFSAFVRQVFNYGRGRGDQMFLASDWKAVDRFIPAFFAIFVLMFPVTRGPLRRLFRTVLRFYAFLCCFFAAAAAGTMEFSRIFHHGFGMPDTIMRTLLFPVMHLGYGAGIIFGLAANLAGYRRPIGERVRVVRIKNFGEDWQNMGKRAKAMTGHSGGSGGKSMPDNDAFIVNTTEFMGNLTGCSSCRACMEGGVLCGGKSGCDSTGEFSEESDREISDRS
jgi:glycosyltransferase involved in cell wall biosynthesis